MLPLPLSRIPTSWSVTNNSYYFDLIDYTNTNFVLCRCDPKTTEKSVA